MENEKKMRNFISENMDIDSDLISSKPNLNISDLNDLNVVRPALLLHSCCGPCSTAVIERLNDKYDITVYFYNPNITDKEEYEKRKASQIEFIDKYNRMKDTKSRITFLEGPYEPEMFNKAAAGLEHEPEGGKRCTTCFLLRLEKTAETASISGYDCFTTTLTVSPHKNFELIYKIGMQIGMRYNLSFIGEDFKKKAGYQRSIELSKAYGLYRQNYCGCGFSYTNYTQK